jgi:hypothetical protein
MVATHYLALRRLHVSQPSEVHMLASPRPAPATIVRVRVEATIRLVRVSPDWKRQHEGISSSPQRAHDLVCVPSAELQKLISILPSLTSSFAIYPPHRLVESTSRPDPVTYSVSHALGVDHAQRAGVISRSGSRAPSRERQPPLLARLHAALLQDTHLLCSSSSTIGSVHCT